MSASPISPVAKRAVNSPMKPRTSAVECSVASIAMAAVGSRHATMVATKDVKKRTSVE